MKRFQGRVITAGTVRAEALVSHGGFNTLASLEAPLLTGDRKLRCSDQNNPDLYHKAMQGKAICLPETIGSTTGGMALFTACARGMHPACLLFSKHIDSLAAAGAVLSDIWTDVNMPVIDMLGDGFLEYVKDGMMIDVQENGVVEVDDRALIDA